MNGNETTYKDIREQPPRRLNIFTQIKIVFGGFMVQFGAAFFWFGMIFTLVFVGQSELIHLFAFDGDWMETEGVVHEILETSTSVNDEDIYEYRFSFSANGQSYQGSSNGIYNGLVEDNNTIIEYKSKNPTRARVLGTTNEMFPVWIAFVLIFPLVGFFVMFSGFRKNIKALRLIKIGKFTRGKMLSYKATNTEINEETVYAYEFEFKVRGQAYIAKCETHLTDRVEDEELEKILYDPANPDYSIVYDAVSSAPEVDKFGKLTQAGILALGTLISTILGVLINGAIFSSLYM